MFLAAAFEPVGLKDLFLAVYDQASFLVEKATWKREVVELKMKLFVAKHSGVDPDSTAIPIFTQGVHGNGYIRYYNRLVRKDGTIRFLWYADIESAHRDAAAMKAKPFAKDVVGPYPLPKDEGDYFQ